MSDELVDDYSFASCGQGWKGIIKDTDAKLKFVDPNYKIVQIKEKFGGLRYYYDQSVEYDSVPSRIMEDIVRSAEHYASRTCERCGTSKPSAKVEVRLHKYWYFGYCQACADSCIAEREAWFESVNKGKASEL